MDDNGRKHNGRKYNGRRHNGRKYNGRRHNRDEPTPSALVRRTTRLACSFNSPSSPSSPLPPSLLWPISTTRMASSKDTPWLSCWEEGRKGGREEGRKGGREEGRKGGREEGRVWA